MRAPEPLREHPNASFVLGTAPLAALLGWLIALRWTSIPAPASAAAGTVLSSALLVFGKSIKRAGGGVWKYGLAGCLRRLWRGPSSR